MIRQFLILLIIPITFYAQNADEIITKVQEKFDEIENFKSEFRQTIYSSQGVETISLEGQFYFKKENSFKITIPNKKIISDGKSVWNFNQKENKVVISNVELNETTFSLNKIIYTYPEKCELTLLDSESGNYYIKAIPNDLELNFKKAYLTFNNNFFLSKVEIIDFNNMKFTFELFSVKLNQKIDYELFKFFPSDEVEVIDLR